MSFDREKFKTLVQHILWRANQYADFGVTKLNKVLWFAEARSFEAYGKPITGSEFVRDKYGPRSKQLAAICRELVREELAEGTEETFYEYKVTRYRATQPAPTDLFTSEELSLVDWWIKHIAEQHTASSISEKSHDYGWEIAKMGEDLPLYAFLASRIREPNDDELKWARSEAVRLGIG